MSLQPLTAQQKQALAKLREIAGGVHPEERRKHQAMVSRRKQVRAALEREPSTIPRIAAELNLPPDEVLWHITAMRKYGQAEENGEDGDYVLYALAAEQKDAGH
jgi:predicted Rossmann fold nucleotide-binding protein DprA/Smf involved in DNA uptake